MCTAEVTNTHQHTPTHTNPARLHINTGRDTTRRAGGVSVHTETKHAAGESLSSNEDSAPLVFDVPSDPQSWCSDVQVLRALLVVGLAVSSRSRLGSRLAGTSMRLVLDSSVRPQLGRSSSSIANMSLSPWTYRESCVESRLPRQIFHAVCLTSGCLSLHGGGEDASLEAKPIYHQVLVLHKTLTPRSGNSSRRRYSLRLGTEVIPVGCTCVRPSVVTRRTKLTL
ncbi:uncharacterized protein ACO6RY_10006 [Pungitius sinensis]